MFIFGDLTLFAVFFVVYSTSRSLSPEVFAEAQASLNQYYGLVNTVLLLLSSWFVVKAVMFARAGDRAPASRFLLLASACGLGFVAIKILEYGDKVREGVGLNTNDFFMYYFLFTGIHFLHVLIGLAVLACLWQMVRSRELGKGDLMWMESGASYWHMVDLLWVVLFALFYLMV